LEYLGAVPGKEHMTEIAPIAQLVEEFSDPDAAALPWAEVA
jgi:hypothetical protein